MIMTKHLPLVAMHNRHDLWSLCVATLAGTLQHSQSTTRFLYLGGGALDAERPFVRRDAEHRDEDASGSSSPVALCIHHSSSEGDVMNAFHGSFLLGEDR